MPEMLSPPRHGEVVFSAGGLTKVYNRHHRGRQTRPAPNL